MSLAPTKNRPLKSHEKVLNKHAATFSCDLVVSLFRPATSQIKTLIKSFSKCFVKPLEKNNLVAVEENLWKLRNLWMAPQIRCFLMIELCALSNQNYHAKRYLSMPAGSGGFRAVR
jgi:hypothetical protein